MSPGRPQGLEGVGVKVVQRLWHSTKLSDGELATDAGRSYTLGMQNGQWYVVLVEAGGKTLAFHGVVFVEAPTKFLAEQRAVESATNLVVPEIASAMPCPSSCWALLKPGERGRLLPPAEAEAIDRERFMPLAKRMLAEALRLHGGGGRLN